MDELTVTFKNGKEIKISTQIANILRDRIIEGSGKPFQCFSDENKNAHFIINVSEIVCVG